MYYSPKKPTTTDIAEVFTALVLISVMLVALLCSKAFAVDPVARLQRQPNQYRLTSVSVHDGDTLKATVSLGFGVVLEDQSIRLAGFDAWEINRVRQTVDVTPEEIEKGKVAKAELQKLINTGEAYLVPSGERDPYGRLTGFLVVYLPDGFTINVSQWMKTNGHTRD